MKFEIPKLFLKKEKSSEQGSSAEQLEKEKVGLELERERISSEKKEIFSERFNLEVRSSLPRGSIGPPFSTREQIVYLK